MVSVSVLALIALALELFLTTSPSLVKGARTCQTLTVPQCSARANRDILILLDASEFIDPGRFYGEMLDYTQSALCAFNTRDTTRAGVILFSSKVTEALEFKEYSRTEWFAGVETIRSQTASCCSCCASAATAFQLARNVFNRVTPNGALRMVFLVTAGMPMANTNGPYAFPGTPAATYLFQSVPNEANLLKQMSRLIVVGVPNKNMGAAPLDYFSGVPNPGRSPAGKPNNYQCVTRSAKRSCAYMRSPPFPIPSTPLAKNTFSTNNWGIKNLLSTSMGSICEVPPTPKPTKGPKTPRPTKIPTVPPTKKPTISPTLAPTNSPIRPELQGLDLYLLLDNSRSMRWVPELCRKAPGGIPSAGDEVACWKLFLAFVNNIVRKVSALQFRGSETLGWQNDFADKQRGLRVSMYAFACKENQRVPVTFVLGEKMTSLGMFESALANASDLVPMGGTCPGGAIERAAAQAQGVHGIVGDQLTDRYMKAAILLTDGLFYDGDRPAKAAQGLFHFNVMTYAMAIAVPYNGVNYGLKPGEILKQRAQLMKFVQNDASRLVNFGLEGIQTLDAVAESFVKRLPFEVVKNIDKVVKQPFWCGWTSPERCTTQKVQDVPTGLYCKWDLPRKTCLVKTWCNHRNKTECNKDLYCNWNLGKCSTRKRYLPGGIDAMP